VSIATTLFILLGAAESSPAAPLDVHFQAHRGGLLEVPENTLAAYRHAWSILGAIPEVDVAVTKDGVMVCMHDDTPERTTTATEEFRKKPLPEIPSEQLRTWDAGTKFNAKYAGEKVPLLTEVFDEMKGRPERQAYLDLKDVDLSKLVALIDRYGLRQQIIFVHGDPKVCAKLQRLYPGARTMTWLSGSPEKIKERFEKLAREGFAGISQLQFHLEAVETQPEIRYALDRSFLLRAIEKTRAANVDLQVRPFEFDAKSLEYLTGLGIRWFVTDEPKRFADTLAGK
jgi:glycerophosphoryl diester phosphodiesterase